jgi:hypothetical protein
VGGSTDGLELVGGGCVRAGVRVSPVSRGSARALGARSACAPCRVSSPFTGCLRSSAFHTLSVCLSHPRLVGVGARARLSERICEMGTLELIMFLVPNPASSCSPIDLLKLAGWLSALTPIKWIVQSAGSVLVDGMYILSFVLLLTAVIGTVRWCRMGDGHAAATLISRLLETVAGGQQVADANESLQPQQASSCGESQDCRPNASHSRSSGAQHREQLHRAGHNCDHDFSKLRLPAV